jgi:hypothetical protein
MKNRQYRRPQPDRDNPNHLMKPIARIPLCIAFCALTHLSLAGDREHSAENKSDSAHDGGIVKSLNGLAGKVSLRAGPNINITRSGNGLTISAAGSTSGGADSNAWHRTGDIVAPGDFLGTLNDQPLEFKVNGQRALRLEPNTNDAANVIGGSSLNFVARGVVGTVIAGGGAFDSGVNSRVGSLINASNTASSDFGVISGGVRNIIQEYSAASVVGGGLNNTIGADLSTVSGGSQKTIETGAYWSTIGGGGGHSIRDYSSSSMIGGGAFNTIADMSFGSSISGGFRNTIASSSSISTIGGGSSNSVSGVLGTVPGGDHNVAGRSSFAAGHRAKAFHQGAFVWADSTDADVTSTLNNQFVARASGGVVFYSNPDLTSGVFLSPGGGSWSTLSDRNTKENVQPVDCRNVLDKLCAMPLAAWNYKTQDKSIRHIGPMAQDFHSAFGVGEDEKHIATVDADGVAIAAIQGLNEKLDQKVSEIAELKSRLERLERLLTETAQARE